MLLLGLLLVVGLAMLGGARADEARAHGDCSNEKTAPFKTQGGVIKGSSRFVCDHQHAEVQGCVYLEHETPGGWVPVSADPECKPPNTFSTQSKQASDTAPCKSGNYRTVGQGHAANAANETVHNGRDTSFARTIACSTNDLLNPQGILDAIGARLEE